jgi:uncharacterized Zn-finger protein
MDEIERSVRRAIENIESMPTTKGRCGHGPFPRAYIDTLMQHEAINDGMVTCPWCGNRVMGPDA